MSCHLLVAAGRITCTTSTLPQEIPQTQQHTLMSVQIETSQKPLDRHRDIWFKKYEDKIS